MRLILLVFALFLGLHANAGPLAERAKSRLTPELLNDILLDTYELSKYGPFKQMPTIEFLSDAEIKKEICPEKPNDCRQMGAFFQTERNRIVVLETLDMKDNHDNSFLVHELVHALQFQERGDAIFATCLEARKTETEAYTVQNLYLKKRSVFASYGLFELRALVCPEDSAQ